MNHKKGVKLEKKVLGGREDQRGRIALEILETYGSAGPNNL